MRLQVPLSARCYALINVYLDHLFTLGVVIALMSQSIYSEADLLLLPWQMCARLLPARLPPPPHRTCEWQLLLANAARAVTDETVSPARRRSWKVETQWLVPLPSLSMYMWLGILIPGWLQLCFIDWSARLCETRHSSLGGSHACGEADQRWSGAPQVLSQSALGQPSAL